MKQLTSNKTIYILTGIAYTVLLLLTIRNLDTAYLWYDESGQFFISKGLNHFSEPFAPEGDVFDVIYNNARYNLDPGGFSIILHYWSMISNHHIWLRLLPFIFYLLTILFTVLTVYEATKDKLYSFISGLCVFMLAFGNMAYLLRAYSMELFATVFGLWSILKLHSNLANKKLLLISFAFCLLITARYSTIMIVFGYSLYISYLIIKSNNTLKNKIIKLSLYGIPLLCMVIAIYFISMRIQNSNAVPLDYLTYLKDDILLIFNNYHLTMYLFFAILLFFRKKINKVFFHVIWPFIIVELTFIILSIMGMQPCFLFDIRGQTLLFLYLISILLFLYFFLRNKHVILFLSLILCISIITITKGGSISTEYKEKGLKFIEDVKFTNESYPKVFVSWSYTPDIRYLYEYTNIHFDLDNYKTKFIFSKGYKHTQDVDNKIYIKYKKYNAEFKLIETLPKGSLIIAKDYLPNCKTIENKQNFYIKD